MATGSPVSSRATWGRSYAYRAPVAPFLGTALANSAKLAAVAFLLVVPLGMFGGVHRSAPSSGTAADRIIIGRRPVGHHRAGIRLGHRADPDLRRLAADGCRSRRPGRADAGFFDQLYHLLLPSIPLVLILFGYIARMARAGTIEALDADYTRTAMLKGLPLAAWCMWRHVLRNALLPTISVIATQTVYLIGGLVVIEIAVPLPGHRQPDLHRRQQEGLPDAAGRRADRRRVFAVATLLADLLYAWLNPRIRYGAGE